jgi:flagellar biosynthetic protein FliR
MPQAVLNFVPAYVLVVFRLAGLTLYGPLFGSTRIPKQIRVLLLLVLAAGIAPSVPTPSIPENPWSLALGIGGEIAFGLAMGMVLSFTFVAVQWAGEIIGQQMGFNLGEVFDPQFGGRTSVVGDLYFMLTLVIFLMAHGATMMIAGIVQSFRALPLLSVSVDQNMLLLLLDLFHAATILAVQVAAPVLITMIVVDLVLGLIGRVMPQMNVMSAALSVRAWIGIVVLLVGLPQCVAMLSNAIHDSLDQANAAWSTPRVAAGNLTP